MPIAGLGVLAVTALYYFLRPQREDPAAVERDRRAYLNRVGRIVEGHVVEVADASFIRPGGTAVEKVPAAISAAEPLSEKVSLELRDKKHEALVANRHGDGATPDGMPKLLFYSYSISGVTYETAQTLPALRNSSILDLLAAGQTASVKYDPSNPSNSILPSKSG